MFKQKVMVVVKNKERIQQMQDEEVE